MSKAKVNALETAINAAASNIIGALETFDRASAVLADEMRSAMQMMIDAASAAGVKRDETGVSAFGDMVRNCETFVDAVAEGMLLQKTVTEYAQGAMRAYFHGVEWTPRLKNDPDMRLPWSKAPAKGAKVSTVIGANASAAAKAAETVATTSKALPRPQLDALLRTTLKALRDAGLVETAAEVLDVFLEIEGFTETAK
jgi:hypothetical protein